MKRIILDHFQRWCLVLTTILIAYFIFQAATVSENNSQTSNELGIASVHNTINAIHNSLIFQAIMWLGFILIWDFQRGLPRVLTSLPVTTKQIGRAWWLASVAFPAIVLGIVGLLAVLIFSGGANIPILLENYLTGWSLAAFYLGATFGALTFMKITIPDTFTDRIRNFLSNSLFGLTIFGFLFIQLENPTITTTAQIFAAYAILSILGWFRAEKMVLQRAGFRLVAKSSAKKTAQHKIPKGFGGLPYLVQRIFVQSTLIGLALMTFMTLFMAFLFQGQNRVQAVVSMIQGGSTPYVFFILIFSIVPIAFQLRFLRTLPVSSSALATTLVSLPVFSIAAVGVIVATTGGLLLGETIILPTANNFLILGAKAAIIVPLVVWRGLDVVTYIFIFLMIISDSFIKLGTTILFHLGSNTPANPWWTSFIIFLLFIAISVALTQRLLIKSSSSYRVRTMPANAWSMTRR
jgi:hypothetical protein